MKNYFFAYFIELKVEIILEPSKSYFGISFAMFNVIFVVSAFILKIIFVRSSTIEILK